MAPNIAFHENLHAIGYGPNKVTKFKIKHLVDPEKIKELSDNEKNYFLSDVEFPVHTATAGRTMGIKPGQPYPEDNAFDDIILWKGLSGSANFLKMETPKDKRRAWRTLNGEMFGILSPLIVGISNGLSTKSYQKGGNIYSIVEKWNPPFLKRIKDVNRKTIPNWENSNQISTHKLSWASMNIDGNDKYIVYPQIQELEGELHDFTNPKYNHKKWDSLESAIKNKNIIIYNNPDSADYFTKHYK